jgi:hypothetical protein
MEAEVSFPFYLSHPEPDKSGSHPVAEIHFKMLIPLAIKLQSGMDSFLQFLQLKLYLHFQSPISLSHVCPI